ncbi:NACHT, LRR and PYD domains-containing protein 3-like isoform 2-T3 [Odontesthes bonariensis]|uniref:NACHT, LRR and PYD domains-containing protein 3-like isoform X2 n=1 Tax=Odontesthes bonariensis TaxID=219752 RepID=UPI003F58A70D
MGSQCSALMRGLIRGNDGPDQTKDEISTTVKSAENAPLLQISPSLLEERSDTKLKSGEESFCRQAEESSSKRNDCSEKSSCVEHQHTTAEVNILSDCPSDPALNATEDKADWVDSNRAELIQSVTLVMPIADQMLQRRIIHKEKYNQIKTISTSQDQMREVYSALTCTQAKAGFYRIYREMHPQTFETEDIIKEVIRKHKEFLMRKCTWEFEGTEKDRKNEKSLDKIYTELHIIQGESEHVNQQHEIWEVEDKTRYQAAEGNKIDCNDIFKSTPEDTPSSRDGQRPKIRTVITKGIAGIGKTVSVKKFILDWADGTANEDLDFIFMFQFRELNLVTDDEFSLETLVTEFNPELKDKAVTKIFANHKVLFVFDGLDESQLKLNFKSTKRLTDPTKKSSVDTVVTNLIREYLLPSALVWITSRPGAIQRIPRQHVYQWTEVRGFNDPQKTQYFKNRIEDKVVAQRIIEHITTSRSLYIMCHIPIFCWIASKVLVYLLLKMGSTPDENMKTPTTLTEMYTHFLLIQMRVATEKYDNEDDSDTAKIFKSNEEFILKLGRMAFEKLDRGEIIFSSNDLEKYGIDIDKAGVHCGVCTAIFTEENVFNTKKLYCFVHLTVQEYFAALFVYNSFARKKIDSQSLKDFLLLIGSKEELKLQLDADPIDLPLNELMEIAIANSAVRKTGELDMFLRFLIGMSLQSTQELLQGLIQQTEEHKGVVEEITSSLKDIDLDNCSPERCLNLVHCLVELNDSSIHNTVQQYLKTDQGPEKQLSPVQCSALADSILMSKTPLEEFNLKKYRPTVKGIFRLIPAVRNCRKIRISGVHLDRWICETISSALQMPHSVVSELHLINNLFYEKGIKILADGLINAQCKLEALSLSGSGVWELLQSLDCNLNSVILHLRELELSEVCPVNCVWLNSSKLEKLRLNRNSDITEICKALVTALTSKPSNLRELELSYTDFEDSEMEVLSIALMSTNCTLEALSLSHNKLTAKGCETLASALTARKSPLRKLDLSYNDLHDLGLKALCSALTNPHCSLETLRLLFCKVTWEESLASALRSDRCSLMELDLSFNYLTDQGVKLLTEIQRDSRCSLEHLIVDQNEECWVNVKLLRQYVCNLTLDSNTAGGNITLTKENKMAIYNEETQEHPDHPDRFACPQVLCEEGLTGRHYWEVECNSGEVGVAYKSIAREGDCSADFSLGKNEKSWCWTTDGRFHHNNSSENFRALTIEKVFRDKRQQTRVIGVYLDWSAGILSFFEVFPDNVIHRYTVHTTFTEPLYPGFGLSSGSLYLKNKDEV